MLQSSRRPQFESLCSLSIPQKTNQLFNNYNPIFLSRNRMLAPLDRASWGTNSRFFLIASSCVDSDSLPSCSDYLPLAYRWAYFHPISASGLALLPVSSASLDAAVPSAALRAMPWRIAAILNKL
jgi:hypothetical protein